MLCSGIIYSKSKIMKKKIGETPNKIEYFIRSCHTSSTSDKIMSAKKRRRKTRAKRWSAILCMELKILFGNYIFEKVNVPWSWFIFWKTHKHTWISILLPPHTPTPSHVSVAVKIFKCTQQIKRKHYTGGFGTKLNPTEVRDNNVFISLLIHHFPLSVGEFLTPSPCSAGI